MRRLLLGEEGAVTVDWVVLTAASIGLALVMMAAMTSSVSSVGTSVEGALTEVDVVEIEGVGYAP
ncbi:hypothetical protein DDE20_11325 [Pararhodobacter oceanensis]|uniref:Pilus assembly protein n=1 Tax=Pararhodobacter oceanensis TaxID=2172121 RepID=A0A2T8HTU1_9RHOB|nr:hypothetical protein DDE20_11325 [Pararhodobacter oceanensis]